LAAAEPLTCAYAVLGIGASLGGQAALTAVLARLPGDFPIPILVVQHMMADGPNLLPGILARRTRLRVAPAEPGERPRPGTVHVARPDHHLLVAPDGTLALPRSERVNFTRPAADVLFRSLAEVFAERAIGLVLTGMGRDGARGLAAIWQRGGLTMAQDDATAEAPSMPGAGIDIGKADVILPLHRLAAAFCASGGSGPVPVPDDGADGTAARSGIATHARPQPRHATRPGERACPSGGSSVSREDGHAPRPHLNPADAVLTAQDAVARSRRLLAEIERTIDRVGWGRSADRTGS
jgi:two-component system chemotaxis response regulator CheB